MVIDHDCNVLLNHHKILDKWLHFGGHSDGESNSLNVAKREVMEEAQKLVTNPATKRMLDKVAKLYSKEGALL